MKPFLWVLVLAARLSGADVLTSQYGNDRSGANNTETVLTPANVTAGKFGMLAKCAVDAFIDAQLIYVQGVMISSVSHNILIVVTENNTVYAFDPDNPCAKFWTRNLGTARVVNTHLQGLLATPVVDKTNGYVYVVYADNASPPIYTISALNLSLGTVLGSTTISGQVVGTGAGTVGSDTDHTSGANLLFYSAFEHTRSALLLANGNVYVAFSTGHGESGVWHGWIFGYSFNGTTFSQIGIFCTTPNGNAGGIWESGGGLAADGSGNIYAVTGNGDWDGVTNFSQSVIKLSPTLSVLDWFTPSNESATSAQDADLSSGRQMLIPNTTLLVLGSKDFRVWLLDTTNLGGLQGMGGNVVQVFNCGTGTVNGNSGIFGGLFINSSYYCPNVAGPVRAFAFSSGSFNTTAEATSTTYASFYVALSGSSNNGSNGIIWLVTGTGGAGGPGAPVAGTLRALNPATLVEYWTSGTNPNDALGNIAQFAGPTISNGKVFVPTYSNQIDIYGLLSSSVTSGNTVSSGRVIQ